MSKVPPSAKFSAIAHVTEGVDHRDRGSTRQFLREVEIGLIGLGVMGASLALNFAENSGRIAVLISVGINVTAWTTGV